MRSAFSLFKRELAPEIFDSKPSLKRGNHDHKAVNRPGTQRFHHLESCLINLLGEGPLWVELSQLASYFFSR